MSYQELLAKLQNDLGLVAAQQAVGGHWYSGSVGMWVLIAIFGLAFIAFCFWFFPIYGIWSAHKQGLAELALAQNEQRVQVTVAQGRFEAAELNKKAAIVEAEAVAKQIETIGSNLKEHDLYLKWQWIKMMEERPESSTIYIPTEAGLPILEAGKRS